MSPEDREILRSVQMACVAIVSAVAVAGATILVGGLFIQTDTAEPAGSLRAGGPLCPQIWPGGSDGYPLALVVSGRRPRHGLR